MQATREQGKSKSSSSGKSKSSSSSSQMFPPTSPVSGKSIAQRVMEVIGDTEKSILSKEEDLKSPKESSNTQESCRTNDLAGLVCSLSLEQESDPVKLAESRETVELESPLREKPARLMDGNSMSSLKEEESKLKLMGDMKVDGDTRISLDTKVPHPFQVSQFASSEPLKQMSSNSKDQEVGYYNDAALSDLTRRLDSTNKLNVLVANHQKPQQQQNCYLNDEPIQESLYDSNYDEATFYDDTNVIAAQTEQQDRANPDRAVLLDPENPKAESAPATPCNVTPIAFHQHNAMLNPNSANTLPTDKRENISRTSRVAGLIGSQIQADLLVQDGESMLKAKNFEKAIELFTQWEDYANNQDVSYRKKYFKVFSQRAEAHFSLAHFQETINDCKLATRLNVKWVQAYYHQGRAESEIGRYPDSLAAFSLGLRQEPNNERLLGALIEAARKSPLKDEFEQKYRDLQSLNLDKDSLVVVATFGQGLLVKGHRDQGVVMLESAVAMNPDRKRLICSVYSMLASACYQAKDYEQAVDFMQNELTIQEELNDVDGKFRVLSNLGHSHYRMNKLAESIKFYRSQVDLGMQVARYKQVCSSLNALGHVHSRMQDFNSALNCHIRCLGLVKTLEESDYTHFKEILSIGFAYSMLGHISPAEDRYKEAAQMLQKPGSNMSDDERLTGEIMLKYNLGFLALKRKSFQDAKQSYDDVIELASRMDPPRRAKYEKRAREALDHTNKLFKQLSNAQNCFDKQLVLASSFRDGRNKSRGMQS